LETSVGRIEATDPDKTDRLYYRLDCPGVCNKNPKECV